MKGLIPICVYLLLVIQCQAIIITVDDDGPANYNDIQAAINSADDGDTIIVQPGFYEENINFLDKNITLTSASPANPDVVNATIIQGDVVFRGTEDPNCILVGFKINARIVGVDHLIDPNGENHTHATIAYCVLQGNGTCGGTVMEECDGTINNCLIADNSTICLCLFPVLRRCHGLIKNCTIASNNSGVAVGDDGSTTLQNCIIYHNFDHYWAQISVGSGGTVNISYCDVQNGLEEIYLEDSNCIVNLGPGNINTDPCFVRVGYWDKELEQLIEGDYYLQSVADRWDPNTNNWVVDANTSICIDAGNPGCTLGSEFNDGNNVRINMGAYGGTPTASKSPLNWHSIADLTNDDAVNSHDLATFVGLWLGSGFEQPADMDRNRVVDFADFDIFANNWLWQK